MHAHRLETTINPDGRLTLDNLPFQPGETVEVIILAETALTIEQNRYPLRGLPVQYEQPTEPVALNDWETLR